MEVEGTESRFPTVLVIDDDAEMQVLCATLLGHAGYSLLRADGSAEALEIADTYPDIIHLVLLDLLLYPLDVQLDRRGISRPRVHGDQLLPMLRAKRPSTRMLLMSTSSPWRLAGRGMGPLLRQYSFLQKPFTTDALLQAVQRVLELASPGSEPSPR
jgi:DNA-binding NtrC family response regulator